MISAIFYSFILVFTAMPDTDINQQMHTAENDSVISNFILRVEDLYWQNNLNYISLDRMSVKTGTRRFGLEGPQPTFLLDGIPFKPDYFGTSYSQLFPLPLPQINGLETRQGTGVSNGVVRHAASVNFISEPVPDGISFFLSGQAGHNTGEPGPWVYDPESITPNVERFGPWGDAGISIKTGPWYAKGTVRSHSYKRMDLFVQNRFKSIRSIPGTGQSLEVDAITTIGLLETGWRSNRLDIRLQAIQSDGKDFFFFQPLGREVPAVLETEQYSALGEFKLTDIWLLRTLYQQREHSFSHRRNQFDHEFGLTESENSIRFSTLVGTESNFIEAGTELEQVEISGQFFEDSHSLRRDNLFLNGRLQVVNGLYLNGYQNIMFRDEDYTLQSQGSVDLDLLPNWSISIGGGFSELFPDITNPIDYRINNGYNILENLNIPSNQTTEIENSRLTSLTVGTFVQLFDGFELRGDIEFINHLSLHIPFQPVDYNLAFSTFPGNYSLLKDQKGRRLYTGLTLNHTLSGRFEHSVIANFSSTVDGNSDYRNYWKTIPDQVIRYQALFKPYPDLELMMNIQYRSETTWEEFSNLDGKFNRSFHDQIEFTTFEFSKTTPSHLIIDFRVAKWFWRQRLRGVLLFKNVLNQDLQYHPIGVTEDFGFMARVELRF